MLKEPHESSQKTSSIINKGNFLAIPAVWTRNNFTSVSLAGSVCPLAGLWLLPSLRMPIFQCCFSRAESIPLSGKVTIPRVFEVCVHMCGLLCCAVYLSVCETPQTHGDMQA